MSTQFFILEVIGLLMAIFLLPRAIRRQVFSHHEYRQRSKPKLKAAHRPPTDPEMRVVGGQ